MIALTNEPFDPAAELAKFCAGRTETGAVASFVGLARGERAGDPALELEIYAGFTEARVDEFVRDAVSRFELEDARVVHRYGPIAVGEPIVLVLTAARHRRAAFEACEFLMDHLKSDAPIWKREGDRWIEPTDRDRASLQRWSVSPPSPEVGRATRALQRSSGVGGRRGCESSWDAGAEGKSHTDAPSPHPARELEARESPSPLRRREEHTL